MRQVIYQIILMCIGFFAMFKGGNWEPFFAASLVCAAIYEKGSE